MAVDEVEVYLTPDGLGRAAIVRRSDGFFFIYVHWLLAPEYRTGVFLAGGPTSWIDVNTPVDDLYRGMRPESGILGTLDDARRELRSIRGFSDALLRR
jgi:hypothetical protein